MKPLHKIFYLDPNKFEETYAIRREFDTTITLPLTIKPMNQRNVYNLYFIPDLELLNLCLQVQDNDNKLYNLFIKLPKIARNKFIAECIVDELQNTNEIEGVRSSREEIVRSVKALEENQHTQNKRFLSMILSYDKLINDELNQIKSPEDIRKIYDSLLENEIAQKDLPDGKIFRKEECFVYKKSGTQNKMYPL